MRRATRPSSYCCTCSFGFSAIVIFYPCIYALIRPTWARVQFLFAKSKKKPKWMQRRHNQPSIACIFSTTSHLKTLGEFVISIVVHWHTEPNVCIWTQTRVRTRLASILFRIFRGINLTTAQNAFFFFIVWISSKQRSHCEHFSTLKFDKRNKWTSIQ